ncbi:glycosyltransferase family 2 protein [Curtobacterium sp. MCBA15_012]|uniref:glycosyltransferase family 2 protein n=1 Tax=Curtobacterium sp. MCBA15_012 TaxID=1898738 RepID=UPI0008DE8B4C|nr:glycosyltransferase family 2 protein [Curtobacterium sp. MCBA15_012]WIA99021.1 glycosyltransferase family 2 protein [Curtobacterium sp. MCBA15_012]
MSRVAVVTVAYDSTDALDGFLASVRASDGYADVDVVVVDNASSEQAAERAVAERHGARFVDLPDNRGYGGGVAAGVATLGADVEYVLVSNPDVEVTPGAIGTLVEAATRTPGGAVFGPRIIDADGEVYPSARNLPSIRTGIGHAAFGRMWPGNPWSVRYKAERDTDRERDAGWLSGACLLVRRDRFAALGGFDEGYFMYFEDVDLGARVTEAGWANRYVPSAVVTHSGAHSTARNVKRMEREHHRSAYRFLSRRYDAWWLAPLRLVLRVGLTARARWVTRGQR